MDPAGRH